MKFAVQYVNDSNGKLQAVQIPLSDWEKLIKRLKKYEQSLKLKSDLEEAFSEVAHMKKSKVKKQNLKDFLNEL
jgi:hypothetical protein